MPLSDANLLASTIEEWVTNQVVDSWFDSTEVVMSMLKSPAGAKADGGDQVCWTIRTGEIAGSGAIDLTAAAPAFTISPVSKLNNQYMEKAILDWKTYGLTIQVPKVDLDVYNKGRGRVINLAMTHLDTLKESFKKKIAQQVWQSSNTASEWVTLRTAINSNSAVVPVVPVPYAGISTAAFSSRMLNKAGVGLSITDIIPIVNRLRMQYNAKDLKIVCGFDNYERLEAEARVSERFTMNVKPNTELGIPTFQIHGCDVIVDPYLDAGAGGSRRGHRHGVRRVPAISGH